MPVIPEPGWTRSITSWAAERGVDVVPSGDAEDIPADARIDLALSVFYEKILRAPFIDRCGRIMNLHNGPLPRYRGVRPINWALKNGESSHGVTIHEITPGIDEGPIVAQLTYSLYPEIDEVEAVYNRALAYGWTLFEQTMPILDSIQAVPQDEELATYYSLADDDKLGERSSFTRRTSGR